MSSVILSERMTEILMTFLLIFSIVSVLYLYHLKKTYKNYKEHYVLYFYIVKTIIYLFVTVLAVSFSVNGEFDLNAKKLELAGYILAFCSFVEGIHNFFCWLKLKDDLQNNMFSTDDNTKTYQVTIKFEK